MNKEVIFIDPNIPLLDLSLKGCGKVYKFKWQELNNQVLKDSGCSILLIRSQLKMNEELLKGTNVKLIVTATSGTDHVDTKYLKANNIQFESAIGTNANSVAEYVVFAMLYWAKRKGALKLSSRKKIGIVGFGHIGKLVAKYAHYFGMKIFVNDPPLRDSNFQFPPYTEYASLEKICSSCDFITNHVPMLKSGKYKTVNLFNSDLIDLIQPNKLFIHTSRGKVVDEAALMKKTISDTLSVIIDVFADEPHYNSTLAKLAMLSTPHIAGHSWDAKIRGTLKVAEVFQQFTNIKPHYNILQNELESYKPMEIEKFNDEIELYKTIKYSRMLQIDYKTFIKTVDLPENEKTEKFDSLRKNYPKRREVL